MIDFQALPSSNQDPRIVQPILQAAKKYAAMGWYVFPLHSPIVKEGAVVGCTCEYNQVTGFGGTRKPNEEFQCDQAGKHPKIVDWENRATIDPDQVFKWFGRLWSIDKDRHGNDVKVSPNIGIACGKSGILALDADSYKDAFTGANFELDEECPTQISGGGGSHYIYRMEAEDTYNNSSNGVSEGIDIRGHGGLIVASPSLHKSGNRYAWELDYSPDEIKPPSIPTGLREILDQNIQNYCTEDWGADADGSVLMLQQIIDTHDISGNWNRRTKTYSLSDCPFSSEHSDGAYVGVVASGALYAGCHHGSCKGKNWEAFKELYPMVEREEVGGMKSTDTDTIIDELATFDSDKAAMRTWALQNIGSLSDLSESDREVTFVRIAATAGSGWTDKTLRSLIDNTTGATEKKTVAQKINDLVLEKCTFYINQFQDLMVIIDGEHMKTRTNAFNGWVRKSYYQRHGAYPGNDVVQHLKGHMAIEFEHDQRITYHRVASEEECVTVCLGNGQYVKVSMDGWDIADETAISFINSPKMENLIAPMVGGDRELLRKYINVTDELWPKIQAWIAFALYGKGPFPVLVLSGSAGSAKTSTSRRIRDIIDPQVIKDMALPYQANPDSIMLSAKNGYVLAYDNISTMSREVSDTLCRIATGAGSSTRQLYSDDDEVITVVKRPIILTGITDFVADKEDLLSRSIIANLPRLEERKTEGDLNDGFKRDLPSILGGFIDLLTIGMQRLPETTLDNPPRMADYAHFTKAIAPFIGLDEETIIGEMLEDETQQQASIVHDSQLGNAIIKLMGQRATDWEGNATELLSALKLDGGLLNEDAPTVRKLGNDIRRLNIGLNAVGLDYGTKTIKGRKTHYIAKIGHDSSGTDEYSLD